MKGKKNDALIFGRHPVVDAIKNGQSIDKVYVQQGIRGEFEKEVRALCKDLTIPLQVVPKEKLDYLTWRKVHQGIAAYISMSEFQKIEDHLPIFFEQETAPLLVVLEGVTDVRNFGAIGRTAEGSGCNAIVIGKKRSAPLNEIAMKTSAGALSKLPVCREASILHTVSFLKNSGIQVIASSLHATKRLDEIDFSLPTAIVMGAEDSGVSREVMAEASEVFTIPMNGTTDSFNVSVAAGMILYEAMRQREKGE